MNRMFQAPVACDVREIEEGSPEYWAEQVAALVRPVFDSRKPTAFFLGRYQPFHDGHRTLIVEGISRVGQSAIAVWDTQNVDDKYPFGFEYVRSRIEHGLRQYEGRFVVAPVPNIAIFYGRDVGYSCAASAYPLVPHCRLFVRGCPCLRSGVDHVIDHVVSSGVPLAMVPRCTRSRTVSHLALIGFRATLRIIISRGS
jgi:hypothetical protein